MSKVLNKYIFVLVLIALCLISCGSKKTFNGTTTLPCADHSVSTLGKGEDKSGTKWKLVLYKDGKRVGAKSKRGKSKLFDH